MSHTITHQPATKPGRFPQLMMAALGATLLGSAHAENATTTELYFQLESAPEISSTNLPAEWEGWIQGRLFGKGLHRQAAEAAPGQRAVPSLTRSFDIIRDVDQASPRLTEAFLTGRQFPSLTAVFKRHHDGETETVSVILEDVSILSIKQTGGAIDAYRPTAIFEGRMTEEVSFAFSDAQFTYGEVLRSPGERPEPAPAPVEPQDVFLAKADDDDGDGLPNPFEEAFGLDLNGDDADVDIDKDGLTNGEELAAGTDPTDRSSRFGIDRIQLLRDKPGQGLVSFRSLPGRQYRLLGSPTGKQWFELTTLTIPDDAPIADQEIELSFNGLTQLLRVEVTLAPSPEA